MRRMMRVIDTFETVQVIGCASLGNTARGLYEAVN